MLEIISNISAYNVVYAGVLDQSKRDIYFFESFHSLFFPCEVEVVAENSNQKYES